MFIVVGLVIIGLWLSVMTYVVYRMKSHYRNLTSRTKTGPIDEVLDTLITKDKEIEIRLNKLSEKAEGISEDVQNHYQKLGFVRFNPFERVGGDQSFVIALLDTKNSGVVLNFLYTREGIRVYAKRVKAGKSLEYELSAEEQKAIADAH